MSSTKSHELTDSTGTRCILSLEKNTLTTETVKAGKSKSAAKEFDSPAEAAKQFTKKEWELLKKGYLLHDEQAKPGEALLHYFVGSGYTGCLSFADTPDGIFVYKHGSFNAGNQADFLIRIDRAGVLYETIELPAILPWGIVYNPATASLLIDADHFIYEYHLETKTFTKLIGAFDMPASFVAAGDSHVVYGSHPLLIIRNQQHEIVMQQKFDTEITNGSIACCACLSADGKLLAMHLQRGKIEVLQTAGGKVIQTITGDFDLIDQLEFTHEGAVLIAREHYNQQGLLFFDVKTNQPIQHSGDFKKHTATDITKFCFNADQSKLVLLKRNTIWVLDYRTKTLLHHFTADHQVKNGKPGFAGELLGIRTDYGCFSLYVV